MKGLKSAVDYESQLWQQCNVAAMGTPDWCHTGATVNNVWQERQSSTSGSHEAESLQNRQPVCRPCR